MAEFRSQRRRRALIIMLPFAGVFVASAAIAGSPDRLMYALDPYVDRRLILILGTVAGTVLGTRLLWRLARPRWLAVLPGVVIGLFAYGLAVAMSNYLVGVTWGHVVH